jgi:hypothetical protein
MSGFPETPRTAWHCSSLARPMYDLSWATI